MSLVSLGDRLRELRVAEPYLRQREAADYARIRGGHVRLSRIEFDRERPTPAELESLARVYAVPVEGLDELYALWGRWAEAPPVDLNASGVITCRRDGARTP